MTMTYDARNRVVSRSVNGNTETFVYDGWKLVDEPRHEGSAALDLLKANPDCNRGDRLPGRKRSQYDSYGTEEAYYINGPGADEILTRNPTIGETSYYTQDGNGNVTTITDAGGDVQERYTYDVYGTPTITDGAGNVLAVSAVGNRFLFTGREYISQIGVYDYRNRVYSPGLGRFLQTDPIGFEAEDVNVYRYVANNPINLWDPLGLKTLLVVHRSAPQNGQQARDASGIMDVFHDGQYVGSTDVNSNGYQDGSHGVYPGTYDVQPRNDADPTSHFPDGTPALTAPGQSNPGDAGNGFHNVYIHPKSEDGRPDSRGCQTVPGDWANKIKQMMDDDIARGERTTLKIFNYGDSPVASPVR